MERKRMALTLVLGLGLALIFSFVVLTSQAAPAVGPSSTAAEAGVALSPATQAGSGEAGTLVTYTLQLTNQTGAMDSFGLAIQPGHAWTATLSLTETGTLTVGGSLSFTVGVQIPATAAPDEQDSATIVATSVTSPTVYSRTATITTTAVRGLVPIYLPFVARAWPPVPEAPVLDPIKTEGQGGYSLHWSSVALAGSYVLEKLAGPTGAMRGSPTRARTPPWWSPIHHREVPSIASRR